MIFIANVSHLFTQQGDLMILLISNKINTFSKISEKIVNYESTINFSGLVCDCGSRYLYTHGTYLRNVIDYDNDYIIHIKRVKCRECGTTHALIPDFLLPYFQTMADIIVSSISEMVDNGLSTCDIENTTNISRQKLNQWRKRYFLLLSFIRETFSKVININEFLNSKNRVLVYHNWKPIFLIQLTT